MLIKSYSYYFFEVLSGTLLSVPGMLALLFVAAGLGIFLFLKSPGNTRRYQLSGILLLAGLIGLTVVFYSTEIDFEQSDELLLTAKEFADDADCGRALTSWTTSGIGLTNPCKQGCYRGLTTRQQLRMRHFPPWPESRREFQCWVRKQPVMAPAGTPE
ncbi:MAG: hypothetical protein QF790_05210 [Gammaproteobacteria bacterium]|jgi:hypothetical protein|nr:hypothetical protein [Gammaproteobacteria bacterium]MDP6616544.1 hypothetical protein [Gammaproteobacteria bacterium]MDP6694207.1 hypothetical protein [Gammaproteobacteria bacterium]